MSRYDYYNHFEPTQPIATDSGIKAKSQRGAFTKNWWATRWLKALERLVDAGRLRRGKRYARQGQVLEISETEHGVQAKVQGSSSRPYRVSIDITPLTETQWAEILDLLFEQAIFTAQLLSGEMPSEIEQAFTDVGVSLFPDKANQLKTTCSCPDWANPCKHVAAVYYLLGEQFDEDPFMIFRLRGYSQEQILAGLRQRRDADGNLGEDEIIDVVQPLTDSVADFWSMGQSLEEFRTTIKSPITPLPVLKRLGQPSFMSEDLLKLFGPIYETITATALLTTYGASVDTVTEETS